MDRKHPLYNKQDSNEMVVLNLYPAAPFQNLDKARGVDPLQFKMPPNQNIITQFSSFSIVYTA